MLLHAIAKIPYNPLVSKTFVKINFSKAADHRLATCYIVFGPENFLVLLRNRSLDRIFESSARLGHPSKKQTGIVWKGMYEKACI